MNIKPSPYIFPFVFLFLFVVAVKFLDGKIEKDRTRQANRHLYKNYVLSLRPSGGGRVRRRRNGGSVCRVAPQRARHCYRVGNALKSVCTFRILRTISSSSFLFSFLTEGEFLLLLLLLFFFFYLSLSSALLSGPSI